MLNYELPADKRQARQRDTLTSRGIAPVYALLDTCKVGDGYCWEATKKSQWLRVRDGSNGLFYQVG